MEEVTEKNQLDIINFTNIDGEDFDGTFGGNTTTIKAGETRQFPRFQAQHFAKHLMDKILLRQDKDYGSEDLRKPLEAKILGQVSLSPEVHTQTAEVAEPEFAELPKEETSPIPTISETGFKCEVCGKIFSARVALAGHKRSHK